MQIECELHHAQFDFFSSDTPFNALITGRGFGKTYVSVLKAIQKAAAGFKGLVIAPTYTMLKDVLWAKMVELLDAWKITHTKNISDMTIEIKGTTIWFRSAEKPDRIRGLEYGWFSIDEAGQIRDDSIWNIALGGCRQKEPEGWITTTPNGYNWVYDRFGHSAVDRRKYSIFGGETKNNPHLPEEYVKSIYSDYAGSFLAQEVMGEFVSMEGQIFTQDKMLWYQDPVIQDPGFFQDTTICGYLDPATGSVHGDYTAFVTACKKGDLIYILDSVIDKKDDVQMIEVFKGSMQKWNYSQIGIESLFWQKKYFFDRIRADFPAFPFREMKDTSKKQTRIAGIQPLVETKVFFPERWKYERNTDGRRFLDQLFSFNIQGDYRNDDAPDALEGVLRMFRGFTPSDETAVVGGSRRVRLEF